MDDAAALYSIGAIARMTGVSVSTLRTWEDRYGLIVALRSPGGQRRYSRHQLEQLLFI
jgi:DNA-binding transcriptional MerR regulator